MPKSRGSKSLGRVSVNLACAVKTCPTSARMHPSRRPALRRRLSLCNSAGEAKGAQTGWDAEEAAHVLTPLALRGCAQNRAWALVSDTAAAWDAPAASSRGVVAGWQQSADILGDEAHSTANMSQSLSLLTGGPAGTRTTRPAAAPGKAGAGGWGSPFGPQSIHSALICPA